METKAKRVLAEKYVYTVIEKHPLKECYMLYSPAVHWVPPFFGTLRECKKVRPMAESRFRMEVDKRLKD